MLVGEGRGSGDIPRNEQRRTAKPQNRFAWIERTVGVSRHQHWSDHHQIGAARFPGQRIHRKVDGRPPRELWPISPHNELKPFGLVRQRRGAESCNVLGWTPAGD